jgi:hypothetical protein
MFAAVFLFTVLVIYLVEVRLGSSAGVYHSEIGFDQHFADPYNLSLKQFAMVVLPVLTVGCLYLLNWQ